MTFILFLSLMEFYGTTDTGNFRNNNEDYYYIGDNLFIVADGMGGHQAGEVASRMSVEAFSADFNNHLKESSSEQEIKKFLKWSIEKANSKVYRNSITNASHSGMGTTLTSCYIKEDTAFIGHVGDTRLYLKNEDKLTLKTEDHTVVWEMYKNGKLSYEETFSHPQSNILTNVIGTSETIRIDVFDFKIKKGDILVLCSDGLNAMLEDRLISKLVTHNRGPEQIAEKLVSYAKKRGGHDNITVIVIKY